MPTTPSFAATFRRASLADAEEIEALLTISQLPLDGVRAALEGFVVAEGEGRIVGVAGIEEGTVRGEHALLRSVAVDPTWRGKGLGQSLVARAIAVAESRGVSALYLLTTTAEGYFPTFGFVPTAREAVPEDLRATAEFQGACPASAAVMVRTRGAS